MYFFSNEKERIGIECNGCGKVYMYNKRYFSNISNTECVNNTLIQCSNCGIQVQPYSKIESKEGSTISKNDNAIRCPHCGSTQLTAGNKGFGAGKAAAGAVLFGVVGLAGGLISSNKTMITCLKCGKKWEAGKR